MNIRQSLMFTLFEVLITINTISCFYVINDDPLVPCGLRYNERSMPENLQPPLSEIRGRSLEKFRSRSLDESSLGGNVTDITSMTKQKRKLSNMLTELAKTSRSFDQHNQKLFRQLVRDCQKVLPDYKELNIDLQSVKKMKPRKPEDELNADEIVKARIARVRTLLRKIEKSLKIKTRISPEWILTAAHCVTNKKTNQYLKRNYVVGVGSSFWRKGKVYNVVKVIKHPGFTFEEFRHDIALMRVEPPIQLSRGKVAPICLPPRGAEVYGSATIAGWGLTHNDNETPNDFLMRVNIEILNDGYCARVYPNYNSNQMICAGGLNGDRDSCQGDSGGPMQCLLSDGRVYLMGAVSFGDRCGRAWFPGVYTKETSYVDWVITQIAEHAPVFR